MEKHITKWFEKMDARYVLVVALKMDFGGSRLEWVRSFNTILDTGWRIRVALYKKKFYFL